MILGQNAAKSVPKSHFRDQNRRVNEANTANLTGHGRLVNQLTKHGRNLFNKPGNFSRYRHELRVLDPSQMIIGRSISFERQHSEVQAVKYEWE